MIQSIKNAQQSPMLVPDALRVCRERIVAIERVFALGLPDSGWKVPLIHEAYNACLELLDVLDPIEQLWRAEQEAKK